MEKPITSTRASLAKESAVRAERCVHDKLGDLLWMQTQTSITSDIYSLGEFISIDGMIYTHPSFWVPPPLSLSVTKKQSRTAPYFMVQLCATAEGKASFLTGL